MTFREGDRVRYRLSRPEGVPGSYSEERAGKIGIVRSLGDNIINVQWEDRNYGSNHYAFNIEPWSNATIAVGDTVRIVGDERWCIPEEQGNEFVVISIRGYTYSARSVRTGSVWSLGSTVEKFEATSAEPTSAPAVSLRDIWTQGNTIEFTANGELTNGRLRVGCKNVDLKSIGDNLLSMEPIRANENWYTVRLRVTLERSWPGAIVVNIPGGSTIEYDEMYSYGRDFRLVTTTAQATITVPRIRTETEYTNEPAPRPDVSFTFTAEEADILVSLLGQLSGGSVTHSLYRKASATHTPTRRVRIGRTISGLTEVTWRDEDTAF